MRQVSIKKKKMKIKFYDSLVNRINRIRNTRLNIVMIYIR